MCWIFREFALDVLPFFRQLGHYMDLNDVMPSSWAHVHDNQVVKCGSAIHTSTSTPQTNTGIFASGCTKEYESMDPIED